VGAFLAGVVTALVTGMVVAVVVLPVAVLLLPPLFANSGEDARIARMNGIAKWTRNLANLQVAGLGLEQAILANRGDSAPLEIRDEVNRLANRIQLAHMDTKSALRHFADDLDDYTGDMVCASLMLASRERGSGLASVLVKCSESVDEQVRARLDIEADRKGPRQEARQITVIGLGIMVLIFFSGQLIAPYTTALGQIILTVLLAGFGGSVWMMRRISQMPDAPRFIGADVELLPRLEDVTVK
jgi:Flp pilus assembly protein TadB